MKLYKRPVDYLWIVFIGISLIPVLIYSSKEHSIETSDIQGPLLNGRRALDSLIMDAEGTPLLINFWATWCSPCVGELPEIDDLFRSMGDSVSIVAVSIDENIDELLRFREQTLLAMPVVHITLDEREELSAEWELQDVVPVTIILSPDGEEVLRVAGVRSREFFHSVLVETMGDGEIVLKVEESENELHINVVGFPDDSATVILLARARELAGDGGVDFYVPSVRADSITMDSLYLPRGGSYPYAQPCFGLSCGRPARTPEELDEYIRQLLD